MKTLTFKPQKKKPLLFWSDKLSRLNVDRDVRTQFALSNGTIVYVTCWFYKDNDDKQKYHLSLHVDHNAQVPLTNPGKLYETEMGYICPNCKSNEFLRYRSDLLPMSYKEEARFNRADYGMYCTSCGVIS